VSGAAAGAPGSTPIAPKRGSGAEGNRALNQQLVNEGRAHAALVFDGDVAVGWCQYGSPEELSSIYHRKEYETGLVKLPDYRLTCLFVDKAYRRKGASAAALGGALDLIRQAGGGVVEAYPAGHAGQAGVGLVPLQRHPEPLRTRRLQLRAAQGQEPLRDEHHRRTTSQEERLTARRAEPEHRVRDADVARDGFLDQS
jgi:hypothetical protein